MMTFHKIAELIGRCPVTLIVILIYKFFKFMSIFLSIISL